VDGPEFDGHKVNFDELQDRLSTYREFEQKALACSADNCRLEKQTANQA
jgi:ferredoxin--NADP+ reductase